MPKTRPNGSGGVFKSTRRVTRGGETLTEEVWIAQIRYVDKFAGESRKVRRTAPTEREARAKLKELQATTFVARPAGPL